MDVAHLTMGKRFLISCISKKSAEGVTHMLMILRRSPTGRSYLTSRRRSNGDEQVVFQVRKRVQLEGTTGNQCESRNA